MFSEFYDKLGEFDKNRESGRQHIKSGDSQSDWEPEAWNLCVIMCLKPGKRKGGEYFIPRTMLRPQSNHLLRLPLPLPELKHLCSRPAGSNLEQRRLEAVDDNAAMP